MLGTIKTVVSSQPIKPVGLVVAGDAQPTGVGRLDQTVNRLESISHGLPQRLVSRRPSHSVGTLSDEIEELGNTMYQATEILESMILNYVLY